MKKVDISTIANEIKFENPFILASAPPTATYESIEKAFILGWAGAVIKTVRPESVNNSNVTPRFGVLKDNNRIVGFENIEMLSEKSLEYWVDTVKKLKEKFPTKVVIASLMGADKESWQEVGKMMSDAGADALELNFSCPNGVTEQGLGLAIGQDLNVTKEITSWVKEVCDIPVIVKLTPNVTDIASFAQSAQKGGADGIAAINTVSGMIGVDIETLNPLPDVKGRSTFGGYSGVAVKPIGLRCVAQIAQKVDIDIYGMGGISTWQDAVEYIALGSSVVQVCTEVMISGYSIIKGMISGLEEYMDRKGFSSLDNIKGVALKKITDHNGLSREYKVVAKIDNSKCIKCSKCKNICDESGYLAIYKIEDKFSVDNEKCDGCSLCTCICPKNAIKMDDIS